MSSEKKTLLFMYIDNYCGFMNESFNFDVKRRFQVNNDTICSCPEAMKDFPDNFFGEKISALTLLIGDNGAGKTTLIRLIVKWLCELASGIYPQECGALVIRVGAHNKLIGFQHGSPWKFNIVEGTELEPVALAEIQSTLRDISLVYYTDTMSDLELEEMLTEDQRKYLTDYSLITRLSEALNRSNYFENAKDTMKRAQFAFQMELFLRSDPIHDFPIHFMKFSSIKIGMSKCLDRLNSLGDDGIDMISILKEYGKNLAPKDNGPRMLTRCLLWGFLTGVASSILLWEKRWFSNQQPRLVSIFREAFIRYVGQNAGDDSSEVYTRISDFFENLIDSVSASNENYFKDEFNGLWGQELKKYVSQYVDFLRETEKRYALQPSTFNWQRRSINDQIIYYIDLDILPLDQWKTFWSLHKKIYHMMIDCSFDWQYASSGEKNRTNFMIPLDRAIEHNPPKETHYLWLFLDEPDNTLHPKQKRELLNDLRKVYDKNYIQYDNCQLWISTHSPIMLSDVPKGAAILIYVENNKKKQRQPTRSPFAQQIYNLFDDAFFMQKGIIGALAEEKIKSVYKKLSKLETTLINRQEYDLYEAQKQLCDAKSIIDCLEEPLLKGHILSIYRRCLLWVNKHA